MCGCAKLTRALACCTDPHRVKVSQFVKKIMMIRKPASGAFACVVLLGSVGPINATSAAYARGRDGLQPAVGRLQRLVEDNPAAPVPACLLSGASEVCQSASLVKNTETLFVHVCPSDGSPCDPELCYISSFGTCFLPEISGPFARCNMTVNLLVAGKRITVSLYEMRFGTGTEGLYQNTIEPQNCMVFSNDKGYITNMKGCDESCEYIPVRRPPPQPPTQSSPGFCRNNCRTFRPRNIGGCAMCRRGFVNPPECCDIAALSDGSLSRQWDKAPQSK